MITQRFGCNTYFSAERALYCNSGRETVWGKLHIAARTTTASHPAKKTGSTNTAAAITSPMKPFSDRESEFGGKYDASKDSYRHSATITRTPNGSYKVNVSVSMRGCLGAFDGIGKIEGATLVARTTEKDDTCRLTISKTSNGIAVNEDKCMAWHGASCEFSGTLRKR